MLSISSHLDCSNSSLRPKPCQVSCSCCCWGFNRKSDHIPFLPLCNGSLLLNILLIMFKVSHCQAPSYVVYMLIPYEPQCSLKQIWDLTVSCVPPHHQFKLPTWTTEAKTKACSSSPTWQHLILQATRYLITVWPGGLWPEPTALTFGCWISALIRPHPIHMSELRI